MLFFLEISDELYSGDISPKENGALLADPHNAKDQVLFTENEKSLNANETLKREENENDNLLSTTKHSKELIVVA